MSYGERAWKEAGRQRAQQQLIRAARTLFDEWEPGDLDPSIADCAEFLRCRAETSTVNDEALAMLFAALATIEEYTEQRPAPTETVG